MFKFGSRSRGKLDTGTKNIQAVAERAILVMDFTVIYCHRGEEAQTEAFNKGNSKLPWPKSKHNRNPAPAIDVAPWVKDADHPKGHIPWNDERYWYQLAGVWRACAAQLGIELRWGGDWDGDHDLSDNRFNDLGHYEEKE